MYRLIDDVAARRRHYPSPMPGAPHLVLVDLPSPMRGPGLALGRHYVVVPETDQELAEFEAFLSSPRPAPIRPALLDDRPSAIRSDALLLIRYEPPTSGWPWMVVCRWPDDLTPTISQRAAMARGCYTFEAFNDQAAVNDHAAALIVSLRQRVDLSVQWVSADWIGGEGLS